MAVRREAVRLEVEDHFTREMLKAAAAAQTLEKSLDSLSGTAVRSSKATSQTERDVDGLGKTSRKTGSDINQLSGRLSILARVFATLGPAIAPIGTLAVAALAGLAAQLGFATVGALSLMVAARGVGDALKAIDKARLDPTVANIEAAQEAMAKLAPEAREFVAKFQDLRPVLGDLQRAAAAGWFPGLSAALDSLDSAAPRLERILLAVSTAGGNAIAAGADSLASDRWADFFQFIEDEAPDAIADLAHAVGDLTHGFAELWMAFDPVNDGVRDWLVDVAGSFDMWASGLSKTEGFAEFLAYVNENGPRVADAAGAIGNAVLQIAEAAAPLGGPVLDSLTAIANAIALIADSPLGTPIMATVTAMSALSLAAKGVESALAAVGVGASSAGTRLSALNSIKFGAMVAGIYAANKAVDDLFRNDVKDSALSRELEALANGDWSDELKGVKDDLVTLASGTTGRIIGDYADEISRLGGILGDTHWEQAEKNVDKVDEALAGLVESGNAKQAAEVYEQFRAAIEETHPDRVGQLSKVFDQYNLALENTASASDHASASSARFSLQQQRAKATMNAARDAARESAKAFLDFSDSIAGDKFSLDKWLDAFEAQVTALANWQQNLQTLRERGLSASVVEQLRQQGPAAAQAVAALAKGPAEAIERLNGATRRAGREIRQVGRDAANAAADVNDLDNSIERLAKRKASPVVELRDDMFADKARGIDEDLRGITKKKARPTADLDKSDFQRAIDDVNGALLRTDRKGIKPAVGLSGVPNVLSQLGMLTQPRTVTIWANLKQRLGFDEGGYTGSGGKYEPAGVVHRGEVVIPQHLVRRDKSLLLSRYGHLAGMDQLANGGLAGYANGGRVGALEFAGLPALNLATMNLARLNKALAASEKAVSREKDQRDKLISKRNEVASTVAGKVTSDLFGETDVWTAGGGVSDALSTIRGDIKTGQTLKAQIAQLKKKGLNGGALADLLSNADAATIANFANASAADIRAYEAAYNQRAALAAAVGSSAGNAAFGAEIRVSNLELKRLNARSARIEQAIRQEHKEDRKARKRGAGDGARNRRRG